MRTRSSPSATGGSLRIRRPRRASQVLTDRSVVVQVLGLQLYWDQAVYKKPEKARRFPWHQDNGYAFVEPQQYLTVWLALTDATVDNGCPWVVPGLHRRGTLRHTSTARVPADDPTRQYPVLLTNQRL